MLDLAESTWHAKETTEVCQLLHTSEKGLDEDEVSARLAQYGVNQLISKCKKSLWRMIYEQLVDPMIIILLCASIFSAGFNEWTEAIVIFVIVVVNTVIGVWQEQKAQLSLDALKQMNALKARVIRNSEECIVEAANLVPGDIVVIEDGMKVPADMRLISSSQLKVQEAALTGESLPIEKDAEAVFSDRCSLGDRKNMLYTSSIVTYGRGIGVVTETGMSTEVGKIAQLLASEETVDTPLKRKLAQVGRVLTITGVIVCILVFVIGAIYQRPLIPQLLVAISLAVSVIPEGLPATATVVMALGVGRMAKKNALVSRLSAVETLGNATVICTDKTGTLTLNQMTVTRCVTAEEIIHAQSKKLSQLPMPCNKVYEQLALCGVLCNNASLDPETGEKVIGDPTEGALIFMARQVGIDQNESGGRFPRMDEKPFDSDRKCMTTIHQDGEGYVSYSKGAVDELLPRCNKILTTSGTKELTDDERAIIMRLNQQMAKEALRVLGFAMRSWNKKDEWHTLDVEKDLVFIGMVGMIDPPRKEAMCSIKTCHSAGIRTIMITGDHRITAKAIAEELGIWQEGNRVMTGEELHAMSDEALASKVKETTVFARVSPSDKLRIIKALRQNGEVAAMTGDGVNDSPALKAADIGVAMGLTGTDVAKEAADMILLDDRFTTIADAIKEGRRVYRNIQKVIQFLLAGNIAEMITFLVATIFNLGAPLQAAHILWVNLATATLPALALGVDPASKNIMKHQPVKTGTLFEKDLVKRVITQGIFVATMTLTAFWIGSRLESPYVGQTMAFCVLAFSQLIRSLNQRSNTEPIWIRAEAYNPWLVGAFIVSILLVLSILFIPCLKQAFTVATLSGKQWRLIILLSLLSLVQMELYKVILRLKVNKDKGLKK